MVEIPKAVKAVIFDWDGTVIDSVGPKLLQNQYLASLFGNNLTLEQTRLHWNAASGFPDLLARLTNNAPEEEAMAAVRADYNNPKFAKRNFDFSATERIITLRSLGYHTGLLTNATREILNRDASDLGISLDDLFDITKTVEESVAKKPNPKALEPFIRAFSVSANQLLYIGDELKDYELTVNSGAYFIGVGSGMATVEDFNDAGAIHVPSLKEITTHGDI